MYLPLVFSLVPFRTCVLMVSKRPFVYSLYRWLLQILGGGGFKDCLFLDIPKLGEMIEKTWRVHGAFFRGSTCTLNNHFSCNDLESSNWNKHVQWEGFGYQDEMSWKLKSQIRKSGNPQVIWAKMWSPLLSTHIFFAHQTKYPPQKNLIPWATLAETNVAPAWNMMVGSFISVWNGPFSGEILVFGGFMILLIFFLASFPLALVDMCLTSRAANKVLSVTFRIETAGQKNHPGRHLHSRRTNGWTV